MPSIQLVKKKADYRQLEVVRLYKNMFGTGLKESVEHIDFMTEKKDYKILIPWTDIITAAHFVYQIRKFGLICKLSSEPAI